MLNNLTLCPYFVSQPLEIIHKQYAKSIIYYYMDGILLSDSNIDTLERMFEEVKKVLPKWEWQIRRSQSSGLHRRCGKVQHWNSECSSTRNKQGNQLPLRNSLRASLGPQVKCGPVIPSHCEGHTFPRKFKNPNACCKKKHTSW